VSNGADRCRVCDEPLAPGATFCPRCGTRVEDDAAAQDDEAVTGVVVDDLAPERARCDPLRLAGGRDEDDLVVVAGADRRL